VVGFALLLLFGLASLVRGEEPPKYRATFAISVTLRSDADEEAMCGTLMVLTQSLPAGVRVDAATIRWTPASASTLRQMEAQEAAIQRKHGGKVKPPQPHPCGFVFALTDAHTSEDVCSVYTRCLAVLDEPPVVVGAVRVHATK
ncbi:MAG TPA: hypothetical protein VMZ92_03230, partial [Planctomycetota bacterium]|nr:hypothetical protein [Planctomycetota bacterium]